VLRALPTAPIPHRLKSMFLTGKRHGCCAGPSSDLAGRLAARGVLFFICCLSLVVALAGCNTASLRRAPDFSYAHTVFTEDYEYIYLKKLRGKVIVIFFWSASHVGSRRAIKGVNRLYERYAEKGLEVIGVHSPNWQSFEEGRDFVFERAFELGIRYPVVIDDDGRIQKEYGYLVVPSIYLVDRNGFIRAEYGGVLDFSVIRTVLDQLLAKGAEAKPKKIDVPLSDKLRFEGLI